MLPVTPLRRTVSAKIFYAKGAAVDTYTPKCKKQGMKRHIPVWQSSGKVALDVGVHDWFEMLEFAVLEEVDDMNLEKKWRGAVLIYYQRGTSHKKNHREG